jgi:hypothetical protein
LLWNSAALACGGWSFKDTSSKRPLTFLVNSIQLKEKNRPSIRFMQAGRTRAFFRNGDRIKYSSKNEIEILKYQGKEKSGKRNFKKEILGTFSGLTADIKNYGKLIVKLEKQEKRYKFLVKLNNKNVGEGFYTPSCSDESKARNEAYRVMSYYIWKSLSIDPYAEAAPDWWW